jgi:hypothetical protein
MGADYPWLVPDLTPALGGRRIKTDIFNPDNMGTNQKEAR